MWDAVVLALVVGAGEPPRDGPAMPPEALVALQRVALHLEVVGPEERWIPSFWSELDYVRGHYRATVGAPPLADIERWPVAAARDAARVNAAFVRYCQMQQWLDLAHRDLWHEAEMAACRPASVWNAVADLEYGSSWAAKRRALLRLYETLGPGDYHGGRLPAPIPLHLLKDVSP